MNKSNLLLRVTLPEFPIIMRKLPSQSVENIINYGPNTWCDVTNTLVPSDSVHVALMGAAPSVVTVLKREGWVVS